MSRPISTLASRLKAHGEWSCWSGIFWHTRRRVILRKHPQNRWKRARLSATLANLDSAIQQSGAEIIVGQLPAVYMQEIHLIQIFQNLIGNAIKYRSDEVPRIHVDASEREAEWLFAVRDNGIGIDPEYAENIFGVFKRLHNSEQYAGTGIGLAICRKCVARYGGNILVESRLGQGATFYFTIPKKGDGRHS
jgi:light-regulated signal transduction histidine kinase (bacteriophytochrome)